MTKRTDYHPFRRFWLPMLLACWMLTMFSCASDDAPSDAQDTVGVSLAFDVSVLRGDTRMSDAVTQQPNTPYLGLLNQNLYLFPFNIEGVIGSGETPLSGNVFRPYLINETYHYYMDDKTLDFQVGTASFLCYARGGYESGDGDKSNLFKYGYMKPILESVPNTSNISFEPKKIYTAQTTVEGNVIPTLHIEATDIATYLTAIANAIPSDNRFFYEFVNQGHPIASSSKNVTKLASWAQSWADLNSVTLPERPDDIDGYPANINLPDGAAVVKWNENDNKFEPWTVTTTEVNINRLDRFIYPAELWYYANSRIRTSAKSQKENYNLSDWSKVLAKYENDNAVVDVNVKSVAIKNSLSYAVGCLKIGLVTKSALDDADGTTITLSAGTGEGEDTQSYDFTAMNDDEKIIYDREIAGISMGTATAASLSTATPTAYTNTLVFQTKDGENIRIALEFENNSGQDFMGCNGIVFKDTKFYLVGTIEVPVGQTDDWKKRAFTKSYTTQGTVQISSLRQAYTYLPDLLDPRLEIGIKLIPNWILSTPTNVPL